MVNCTLFVVLDLVGGNYYLLKRDIKILFEQVFPEPCTPKVAVQATGVVVMGSVPLHVLCEPHIYVVLSTLIIYTAKLYIPQLCYIRLAGIHRFREGIRTFAHNKCYFTFSYSFVRIDGSLEASNTR
ncbi:hypothetical protein Plhal304r1_c013g0049881 [Plasmopara halstedii]